MKIILTSTLALALVAFGARAQTSTNPDKKSAASSPSKAEDKGAAIPKDQSSSAVPSTNSATPLDTTATPKEKAAAADEPAATANGKINPSTNDEIGNKKHKKVLRHPEAQGRSGSSDMHRKMQDDSTGKTDKAGKADQPPADNTQPSAIPPVNAPATPAQPATPPAEKK